MVIHLLRAFKTVTERLQLFQILAMKSHTTNMLPAAHAALTKITFVIALEEELALQ